jgi:hypothetical protein
MNNKKRSNTKMPPAVTPQRTQKPRVASTPSNIVDGAEESSPRRRPMNIREAMGHFLADKVDSLCLHPYDVPKK